MSAWCRCCSLLLLAAPSGICAQETHIHVFTLGIPFMSQGYKYSLPCRKPKGLAWNQSWPASRDVTQTVRRSRDSSSGLCAAEMVEGEILQLKAILRALNQRQSYELLSDNMLSQQPSKLLQLSKTNTFAFPATPYCGQRTAFSSQLLKTWIHSGTSEATGGTKQSIKLGIQQGSRSWLPQPSAEASMTIPVHCWPSQKPTELRPPAQIVQPNLTVYVDSNLRFMAVCLGSSGNWPE